MDYASSRKVFTEFRNIRKENLIINLCLNKDLAADITLQPLKVNLDAE